jgi:hypothetical protein
MCVPSTPAPNRKRRTPNILLQERIKKVEALLETYTSQDSNKQAVDTPAMSEVSVRSSPAAYNGSPSQMSGPGKLVVKNGGYKFLDSYIWGTIHDNVGSTLFCVDSNLWD